MLLLCISWAQTANSAPKVLASIKPVHSLVAAVMAGIARPVLLLDGATSPHSYSLRPSDAKKLQAAEIVFRVGNNLETFLNRPLKSLAQQAIKIDLIKSPDLKLINAKDVSQDEVHHGATDMHIWLDPVNARAMVARIAQVLGQADPTNAGTYSNNARGLDRHLSALTKELEGKLSSLSNRPFMVFHNAYGYFQKRFNLQANGIVALNPHSPPSAKRIRTLRRTLQKGNIGCVFHEPQFQRRQVAALVASTNAKTAVLDPLGNDITAGPGHYFALLRMISRTFTTCLQN